MSLINQVLNDLEKRGVARDATGDHTIRVVPLQPDIKLWPYILAGLLFLIALASLWLFVHRSNALQHSIAHSVDAASSIPMTGVLSISHEVMASQPQAVSSVKDAVKPTLGNLQLPPQISVPKANSQVPAPLAVTNQADDSVRLAMTATVGKPIKKVSPQQQAENEFRRAYLLAQQGRLDEAAAGYKLALSLDPAHVLAREALVSVLQETKRYAEAEKVLQDALNLDEKQTHFAMLLARLQVERNAVPQALETLDKSLPYAARLADYQAFIAALMQRQGRHKEAITFYQNALQLSPTSGVWLMGMGISLQAELRKDDALDIYNRALATHNLSPELEAYVTQRIKEIKPKQ